MDQQRSNVEVLPNAESSSAMAKDTDTNSSLGDHTQSNTSSAPFDQPPRSAQSSATSEFFRVTLQPDPLKNEDVGNGYLAQQTKSASEDRPGPSGTAPPELSQWLQRPVEEGNFHLHRPSEENPQTSPSRHQSLLVTPLSHPNGVSIFPSLSTSEQEHLSIEALTQAEQNIVAESDDSFLDNRSDGGYDSDAGSSASTSAESSVHDYMFENGRRYHRFREGMYNFPNDDVEQEREDMKHAMMKLLCTQKLHFAPIQENPQEILDMGTGTGIWAIESEQASEHGIVVVD